MQDKETPFDLFSSPGPKKGTSQKVSGGAKDNPMKKPPEMSLEVKNMLEKIQQMQEELKAKADSIARRSGLSREDVLKMVNKTPATKREFDKMNTDLKVFADKVWGAVGDNVVPQKETLKGKDRKTKTLGARKNWLRMP